MVLLRLIEIHTITK